MNKEKEKAVALQKLRTQRIVMICLISVLLAAGFIIWYAVRMLRTRNRLYRHIVSQNVAMLEEKDKYMSRIEELETGKMEKDTKRQSGSVRESKSKALFDSLRTLMEEKEIYKNPLLTREEVIEMLNTNSTYLTQCIREHADMNYSQFVNSFRVSSAVKILSDKTRLSSPIKDISEDVGFNSLTTFYKLFQQATGMSPSAYRKSLASL